MHISNIWVVAAAVYTTILTNETKKATAKLVPAAAIAAGLPESQVSAVMAVVGTPALETDFSAAVADAAKGAAAHASAHGLR